MILETAQQEATRLKMEASDLIAQSSQDRSEVAQRCDALMFAEARAEQEQNTGDE